MLDAARVQLINSLSPSLSPAIPPEHQAAPGLCSQAEESGKPGPGYTHLFQADQRCVLKKCMVVW